jgi:tetrahydromethanopterin S-methyltransferase subunit G
MQTAINNSVGDWLEAHPVIFRLVQFLIWGTNHPIWGLVILLFIIAIAWSLIKAISSLIETAWLALLKAPFKLSQALFGVSAKSLGKFGGLVNKQLTANKNPDLVLQPSEVIELNKQQRLAEISTRLETIQKEQSELLQEITAILASDSSE